MINQPQKADFFMRFTAATVCILFTYVNVVHGAVEGGTSLWKERRKALHKMESESSAQPQETLLAQLPSP
jgi:hypothetical protein